LNIIFFYSQGVKHFDFIPESYIIPEEFNEFSGKVVTALKIYFFPSKRVQVFNKYSLDVAENSQDLTQDALYLSLCI